MKRDIIFYAANFEPEIDRLHNSFLKGDKKQMKVFTKTCNRIVDAILELPELSAGGKEEWGIVKSIVNSYDFVTDESRAAVMSYASPWVNLFSMRK